MRLGTAAFLRLRGLPGRLSDDMSPAANARSLSYAACAGRSCVPAVCTSYMPRPSMSNESPHRIVPADVLHQAGIEPGEDVVYSVEDGSVRMVRDAFRKVYVES